MTAERFTLRNIVVEALKAVRIHDSDLIMMRMTLHDGTRRYATLNNVTRRYAALRDVTRRYATLHDVTQRYTTFT